MLESLLDGLRGLASAGPLLVVLLGALAGIIGGAMPGLSAAATIALALPITYGMGATESIILLTAIYTGAAYGGSVTATLLNMPGTPEAAIMTFDGYALTKQGKAGKALWTALISGTFGGLIGTVILIVASVPLAEEALRFGPPEYAALAVIGLTAMTMLTAGGHVRSGIAVTLGVLVATVGTDPISGVARMTMGRTSLLEGIELIPALIGLFAVSEAFSLIAGGDVVRRAAVTNSFWGDRPTWRELRRQGKFMLLGTGIGMFVGVKPGGGGIIASLLSYSAARQISRDGKDFGTGKLEGLSTPEAADKAAVGAALIPTLTLGLPASASTAVLISAFTIHNLQPGPSLFTEQSALVYSVFAGLLAANVAVFLIALMLLPAATRVGAVSKPILGVVVLVLTAAGSYASSSSMIAVWTAFLFGVLGFVMKRLGLPTAPVVLGFVLAPVLEVNVRRSLIISDGSYSTFVDHPISMALLVLSAGLVLLPLLGQARRRWQNVIAERADSNKSPVGKE